MLDQRHGVDYQDNAPIAKLCRARDTRNLNQRVVDCADYDLALPKYAINRNGYGIQPAAYDESMECPLVCLVKLKQTREPHYRQDAASILDDFVLLEGLDRLRLNLHDFANG